MKFTNKMTEIYEKITLLENEGKNYHLTHHQRKFLRPARHGHGPADAAG